MKIKPYFRNIKKHGRHYHKSNTTFLKGESRGKFSRAFFSTDTRTDFAKGS